MVASAAEVTPCPVERSARDYDEALPATVMLPTSSKSSHLPPCSAYPESLYRHSSPEAEAIILPSVKVHDIETAAEKRSRTLKHLIKANHANYSIIYHDLRYHNHTPHVRCFNFPQG